VLTAGAALTSFDLIHGLWLVLALWIAGSSARAQRRHWPTFQVAA
jgi:hypothetical protein